MGFGNPRIPEQLRQPHDIRKRSHCWQPPAVAVTLGKGSQAGSGTENDEVRPLHLQRAYLFGFWPCSVIHVNLPRQTMIGAGLCTLASCMLL